MPISDPPGIVPALRRRWYLVFAGFALTAVATLHVHADPGVYWTQSDVVFLRPQSARYPNTIENTSSGVIATAGLVAARIQGVETGPSTASAGTTLAGEMVHDGYAVRLPDSGGQWAHNFTRSVLDVQVISPDSERVSRTSRALIARISRDLDSLQNADHVPQVDRITLAPAPNRTQVFYLRGRPARAAGATLAAGASCTVVAAVWADGLLLRRRRHRSGPQKKDSGQLPVAT